MRDLHWWVSVDYQQIGNGNIANQIHGFTTDYGKFILIFSNSLETLSLVFKKDSIFDLMGCERVPGYVRQVI